MTGDIDDQVARLKSLLPRWFADENPILDATLYGFSTVAAFLYGLIVYASLQTRILTATDGWLDMIAADFFGTQLQRRIGESDDDYRIRIITSMFRERATRESMRSILLRLTGYEPIIIEPWRPADTGGYGIACGYGVAGYYGSLRLPYQAFVTVQRPGSITDADVYAAIESTKVAGTLIWTRITT